MKLEKRIYSGYAYSNDLIEKGKINREIYEEIKDKAVIEFSTIHHLGQSVYNIISNPENLTNIELALICANGDLCFGYSMLCTNQIEIYRG